MKKYMALAKSVLISSLLVGVMTISSAAYAQDNIMLRVNGLYCNLCSGGLMTQLKRVPGVSSVKLWYADGIIAVVPQAGAKVNLSELVNLVTRSSYTYIGAYNCPKLTADLNTCKRAS